MSHHSDDRYASFSGTRLIAAGDAASVAVAAAGAEDAGPPVLIFEDRTGRQLELDRRGPAPVIVGVSAVAEDTPAPASSGRGRPKLGVVAREVTLLPRHWQWLETQSGGASAALRRLVDQARRDGADKDRTRDAQQAVYRVMSVLAGNLPGFEEAARALFACDDRTFDGIVGRWPGDVHAYIARLAATERETRAVAL